jgi:glycine oxidase
MPSSMRVAIVGGGVMGCATALALAARGADVVLLERSVPGAEASSAAAGILGAQVESREGSPLLETFARARADYAGWAAELRETTGLDVGYRVSGMLRAAFTEDEAKDVAKTVAWQKAAGLRAEALGDAEARAIEPALADVLGAAYFPDEAQVDPRALLRALVAAIARSRVVVRSGVVVQRLAEGGGRCSGVVLEGETLEADATVLAAGSWSSLVPGVPAAVPRVVPVRGQIVQLEERPPRVRTMIKTAAGYVVPRGDGRVVCGSTMEHAGYASLVTAGGVRAILDCALRAVPSLANAELSATWSSFRPYAGDDTAWLVGASPLPGLYLATGHHRNGILLAKATADRVTHAILG